VLYIKKPLRFTGFYLQRFEWAYSAPLLP